MGAFRLFFICHNLLTSELDMGLSPRNINPDVVMNIEWSIFRMKTNDRMIMACPRWPLINTI